MSCTLLMSKVDDTNIEVQTAVVDGLNVTTAQSEQVTDALILECLCSDLASVDVAH